MADTRIEVSVEGGRIRGIVENSIFGVKYFAFRGIPYAKPPVNDLRFLDPLPPTPWTGVKDTITMSGIAAQYDQLTGTCIGGEDCLYLNVYTKSLETSYPVMVWIHGGAFVSGSGDESMHGADYLIDKDIVLVTINYRLGVLGFLNLEDEVAHGNQGLKDQVMALKWVQKNIKNFGGDDKNVTIFGASAGAACVHHLTLSPLSQGLFHKAISQSGTIYNHWANVVEEPKKYGYMLVEKMGKKCSTSQEVVDYLRSVDAFDIVRAQSTLYEIFEEGRVVTPFTPGIDSKSSNPFMPRSPLLALESGVNVPFLLGYNSEEGLFFLRYFDEKQYRNYNYNFENVIPKAIKTVLERNGMGVSDLKRDYFGDETIDKRKEDKLVQLTSDLHLIRGIHDTIESQIETRSHPTYFYIFSYDQGYSILKTQLEIDRVGTCHGDELSYIFHPHILKKMGQTPHEKGTTGYQIMQYFTEMWTNFAKTGNPTPKTTSLIPIKWIPVHDKQLYHYMAIGEKLEMKTLHVSEHSSSWEKKYK